MPIGIFSPSALMIHAEPPEAYACAMAGLDFVFHYNTVWNVFNLLPPLAPSPHLKGVFAYRKVGNLELGRGRQQKSLNEGEFYWMDIMASCVEPIKQDSF